MLPDIEKLSFIEKVERFCEIDKKYRQLPENPGINNLDQFWEMFTQLACEAFELKNHIELDLAQNDHTVIHLNNPELKRIVLQFREGEKFKSIDGYENLCKTLNKEGKDTILDDLDFGTLNFDDLLDHFHSWFSISSYYSLKLQVGLIVISKSIPGKFSCYFSEVKEAYAFGLNRSCISLCRALLEFCLTDQLLKQPAYEKQLEKLRKKGRRKDFSLYENIEFAFKYGLLNEELKQEAHEIRDTANDILHFASDNLKVKNDIRPLIIIRKAVKIIEALYG